MLIKLKFRFPELIVGVLLAVAVFAMGMFFSSQPPQNKAPDQHTAEATKQVGPPSTADERIADYTLALAWLTGVLAVSTVALWGVTVLTLRHSRETAERQLRAYIGISLKTAPNIQVDTDPRAVFAYKNFGQTPARELRYWMRMTTEPAFNAAEFGSARFALNPQDTDYIDANLGLILNDTGVKRITDGVVKIYVFGEIKYDDVTGTERTTGFRFEYGGQRLIDTKAMIRSSSGNFAT
jgi:hypothetical protein